MGNYDYAAGGHLVLHEPKVLFELADGDGVIFPSGCITHENIPIGRHEQRRSLTTYSAGCLFSYKEMGYSNLVDLRQLDPVRAAEHEASGAHRWQMGWERYTKSSSLLAT
jgi:hypothetical protein